MTVRSFWSSICDVFASTPTELVHTDYQCTSTVAADKPEKTTSDSPSSILAAAIPQITNNPWHHFHPNPITRATEFVAVYFIGHGDMLDRKQRP